MFVFWACVVKCRVSFPEIWENDFFWRKYKEFSGVFVSWNIINFLILELESSSYRNIRNFFPAGFISLFFKLGRKSALGSPIIYYFRHNFILILKHSQICNHFVFIFPFFKEKNVFIFLGISNRYVRRKRFW